MDNNTNEKATVENLEISPSKTPTSRSSSGVRQSVAKRKSSAMQIDEEEPDEELLDAFRESAVQDENDRYDRFRPIIDWSRKNFSKAELPELGDDISSELLHERGEDISSEVAEERDRDGAANALRAKSANNSADEFEDFGQDLRELFGDTPPPMSPPPISDVKNFRAEALSLARSRTSSFDSQSS